MIRWLFYIDADILSLINLFNADPQELELSDHVMELSVLYGFSVNNLVPLGPNKLFITYMYRHM